MQRKKSAFGKRSNAPNNEKPKLSTTPHHDSSDPHQPKTFPDVASSPFANRLSSTPLLDNSPVTLPIQLTYTQLRPIAYRIFSKKHGLNLKTSGLEVLADFIGRRFGVDWRGPAAQKFMDDVAKLWKQEDRGLFIERDQLQEIIREVLDLSQSMAASRNQSIAPNKQSTLVDMFRSNTISDNVAGRADTLKDSDSGSGNLVTIESLDTSIIAAKLAMQTEVNWTDYYKVIDAYSQPPYEYNSKHKQFELKKHTLLALGPTSSRVSYSISRHDFILDSLIRQEIFTQSLSQSFTRSFNDCYVHTPISNLKGRDNRHFHIFGMITVGKNGEYWIQDPSGKIQISFADTHPDTGVYYFPGSFVIAEGIVQKSLFRALELISPKCEPRTVVREAFGYVDFLGVHAPPSKKSVVVSKANRVDRTLEKKLAMKETQLRSHRMFILGCNIYLDQLKTLDSLRKLFANLKAKISIDSLSPVTFVLMGPFLSRPFQPNGSSSPYKDGMDSLAQILSEYPGLFQNGASVLLIPGDGDPWESVFSANAPATWPMKGIPQAFTNRVQRAAPKTELGSNPCRMAYLSQDIQFVRDDVGERIRRNQIFFPALDKVLHGGYQAEEDVEMESVQNDTNMQQQQQQSGIVIDDDEIGRERDLISELEKVVIDTEVDKSTLRLLERTQAAKKATNGSYYGSDVHVDPEVAESRRVIKTLLDQSTLSPFSLNIRPVAWDYKHALSLAPSPTLVWLIVFLFVTYLLFYFFQLN